MADSLQLNERVLRRLMKSGLPPAVVVGTGITGLTIARALRRHRIPVIGIDCKRKRYTGYSAAFESILIDSQDFFSDGLVSCLHELAELLPRKPSLFLSMDEPVKLVSVHGQNLEAVYHFEFPAPESVDNLMNKEAFNRLAEIHGWSIPKTYCCRSLEDLARIVSQLSFPVILKPRVKNLAFRGNSPRKAFRCSSSEELLTSYRLITQWEAEAIVQEWIPGGDDEVYFSFHYFDSHLTEICSFQGRKIRQWQPLCGSTSSAIGMKSNRLADDSRDILKTAGCVGFGSVEYKRDPRTGRFYVTEPTVGRVNLQVGVAIANGVDIVSRAYFHLIGRPYPVEEDPTYHKKWIIVKSDFKSARYYVKNSELTWLAYLKSLRGPKEFAVWKLADYKMILGFIRIWLGAPYRILSHFRKKSSSQFKGAGGS